MGSLYRNQLSRDAYQELVNTLFESQKQKCFICGGGICGHVPSSGVNR